MWSSQKPWLPQRRPSSSDPCTGSCSASLEQSSCHYPKTSRMKRRQNRSLRIHESQRQMDPQMRNLLRPGWHQSRRSPLDRSPPRAKNRVDTPHLPKKKTEHLRHVNVSDSRKKKCTSGTAARDDEFNCLVWIMAALDQNLLDEFSIGTASRTRHMVRETSTEAWRGRLATTAAATAASASATPWHTFI